ncbi:hypothetical protein [Rubellimicrobium roseum]|nr:hypothetical protein [Rubellimicrobium roseum]
MFQIIAEAISLVAHASGPREPVRREMPQPVRRPMSWPRLG